MPEGTGKFVAASSGTADSISGTHCMPRVEIKPIVFNKNTLVYSIASGIIVSLYSDPSSLPPSSLFSVPCYLSFHLHRNLIEWEKVQTSHSKVSHSPKRYAILHWCCSGFSPSMSSPTRSRAPFGKYSPLSLLMIWWILTWMAEICKTRYPVSTKLHHTQLE